MVALLRNMLSRRKVKGGEGRKSVSSQGGKDYRQIAKVPNPEEKFTSKTVEMDPWDQLMAHPNVSQHQKMLLSDLEVEFGFLMFQVWDLAVADTRQQYGDAAEGGDFVPEDADSAFDYCWDQLVENGNLSEHQKEMLVDVRTIIDILLLKVWDLAVAHTRKQYEQPEGA